MEMSNNGINMLKGFEGCRLAAYQDSVGVWTIGYGWTQPVNGVPVGKGMTITQETADSLLRSGLVQYEKKALRGWLKSPSIKISSMRWLILPTTWA